MIIEKLSEITLNENFGDFSKCEDHWEELNCDEAIKLLDIAYEVSKKSKEGVREFLKQDLAFDLLKEGVVIRLPGLFIREKNDNPKCPRCGNSYEDGLGALSRRDNETEICSNCGTMEAFEDMKFERW